MQLSARPRDVQGKHGSIRSHLIFLLRQGHPPLSLSIVAYRRVHSVQER